MNDTGVTTESELILRRLSDPVPYPAPLESFGTPMQVLFALIVGLVGFSLVAWLFRRDFRNTGWWAAPAALFRGLTVALVVAVAFMPRMAIGSLDNAGWVLLAAAAVLLGVSFVVVCYARDARTAKLWALPLALLRTCVYVLIAGVFLLPAIQVWEFSEKRSRVVIILDVSPSVTQTSDDVASMGGPKPKTRMAKVLDFLTDEQVGFLAKLLEKNPVAVYRFGTRLDDEAGLIDIGRAAWARAEWEAWVGYDFKPWAVRGLSPAGQEAVKRTADWKPEEPGNAEWAIGWAKLPDEKAVPAELSEPDQATLRDNRAKLEKRVDVARSIVLGTNVPESLLAGVTREAPNMVQGVVVFTDGRSNLGSDAAYRTLREKAARDKVPVFTVAVGEAREHVAITITDVQAPDRAPPDEPSKVVVEADGVGLADAEVDVKLLLYLPGRDPKKDAADAELVQKLTFRGDSSPPHGMAEFVLDPEKLPDELTEESKKLGRKRQFKQGQWSVVAKIARDKREVFADAEHVSPPRAIQVIDRPLRVLLFGGPTREYQTLRTLFVREVQQNRAELSICLQTEGGREGTGVQDVPAERLLSKFPTRLDTTNRPTDKPEDKFANLNEYDLIVAFDPDWSELSPDQVANIQTWVDNLGGGLIYVAGPQHTYQLARADETGRLKPLLDVLPVLPDDIILVKTRPVPRTPRRLLLKPNPEFDVLKLDDAGDGPAAGWETFFTGRDKFTPSENPKADLTPERGFFAYYPVKETKPAASVLATFLDVKDNGEADPKPWLVTTQPGRGRSVFVAAGELWRLRMLNAGGAMVGTDYYNRIWVKLGRYAAGNREVKESRGRVLVNKEFSSGSQVRVQARLLAPNGKHYDPTALSPKFRVEKWNAAGDAKEKEFGPFELRPKKGGGEFDGYYNGQVLADAARFPPGDSRYRIVVDVPDSPGDTLTGEFVVKKSDPELDNTRPDFAALEQAAGTLEEVKARIKDPAVLEKLLGAERNPANVKLAFRLGETEKVSLIPACIDQQTNTFRNRGAVVDLWDKPAEVGGVKLLEFTAAGRTIAVGWVLFAVVGLLSLEWLTRKLLRLA